MRAWVRTRISGELTRLRRGGRAGVLWSLRITVAAVASYVVGTLLFPDTQPLLAPLTAMLTVQVTPVSLLASGLDRVVAVVAGVCLAVAFAAVVPLEWWSLGLLIALAITIGQALRLRSNLIEVAISGMLVLGVGTFGAESAAWQRLAETLVGAAVGVAANLLFPPKVASADAGQAIDDLADSLSGLLNRAAERLADLGAGGQDVAGAATGWLDEARTITHNIPAVGAALLRAEQGRRFNIRAVGTPDLGPGLRQGLEALEHSAVTIRGMFRALVDATYGAGWTDEEIAVDVLTGLAQTFRELAAGVDAFGDLVRVEADPAHSTVSSDVQRVRIAMEGLHEARARLDDLVLMDSVHELLELHTAVLSTVKRLTREMDLDERVRRQLRLLHSTRPRLPQRPRRPGTRRAPPPGASEVTPDAETQLLPRVSGARPGKPGPRVCEACGHRGSSSDPPDRMRCPVCGARDRPRRRS